MAERRSIYKKISLSETIDRLSTLGQLFFTWSIPHADDVGLLPRSPKILRGMVFPLKDGVSAEEVEKLVQEGTQAGLYETLEHEGEKYLYIRGFDDHQTLKKDRNPQTILPYKAEKSKVKNWEKLQKLVDSLSRVVPSGFQTETEGKGREGKGSKKKEAVETAPKDLQKDLIENAAGFIRFFSEATQKIRHIKPVIEGGKDGRLINARLKQLGGDMARLEQLTIWYLTRKKNVKVQKPGAREDYWTEEFKNPPAIATMLSASFFNQLLSEEQNANSFMAENMAWIEQIYAKAVPAKPNIRYSDDDSDAPANAKPLSALLAERFRVKQPSENE